MSTIDRFVPPRKAAPAPSVQTFVNLNSTIIRSLKAERDVSGAKIISASEQLKREKEAKKREREAKKLEKTLTSGSDKVILSSGPSGEVPSFADKKEKAPKPLPGYKVTTTDGHTSGIIGVDTENMGFLPAIKLHAEGLADRMMHVTAQHGYFLVTYRTIKEGLQTFTKVEISYYCKAGSATLAGEKAVKEGADRFTVSSRLSRGELLAAERMPSRDPVKRLPNVWVNRQHKQTWGWGESRCRQTRSSFSWG